MIRCCVILTIILLLGVTSACWCSSTNWDVLIYSAEPGPSAITVGAKPGYQDGYNDQAFIDTAKAGVYLASWHVNGPDWLGATGFFWGGGYASPIVSGSTKTWDDIYLWSQNWTPSLGNRVGIARSTEKPAPKGYWAMLTLDYVPDSLNWTGPLQYAFPLDKLESAGIGYLPVPITSNPYDPTQVTRMHLTVYAPEPSSFAALGLGLVSVAAYFRKKRL